jgi:hypothetical protein
MAQPSVSSFFITRKRGLEDDLISSKKKVICLEINRNSSESRDGFTDSEELGTQVVFPKASDNEISNDEAPKKIAKTHTVRQGITPQRTTRAKKVHMQEVDGIQTPKIVNFWKGGNLSPQKKAKGSVAETVITPTTCEAEKNIVKEQGMSTPVKQNTTKGPDTIEKTGLISSNGLKADEIKKKLKGSNRLAELKTRINQLNNGFDRLDQMEKRRLSSGPMKEKPPM